MRQTSMGKEMDLPLCSKVLHDLDLGQLKTACLTETVGDDLYREP